VEGVAVEGAAVEGVAVEGVAVEGVAVEGAAEITVVLAAEGATVAFFEGTGEGFFEGAGVAFFEGAVEGTLDAANAPYCMCHKIQGSNTSSLKSALAVCTSKLTHRSGALSGFNVSMTH
jgi:hypothetical protein